MRKYRTEPRVTWDLYLGHNLVRKAAKFINCQMTDFRLVRCNIQNKTQTF